MLNPIPGINMRHDRSYHWPRIMELKAPFICVCQKVKSVFNYTIVLIIIIYYYINIIYYYLLFYTVLKFFMF